MKKSRDKSNFSVLIISFFLSGCVWENTKRITGEMCPSGVPHQVACPINGDVLRQSIVWPIAKLDENAQEICQCAHYACSLESEMGDGCLQNQGYCAAVSEGDFSFSFQNRLICKKFSCSNQEICPVGTVCMGGVV